MRTYGQYCPIARASELLAERWSIIILRNIVILGCRNFNEIADGAPGLSRGLLSKRLRELRRAGVIEIRRKPDGPGLVLRAHRGGSGVDARSWRRSSTGVRSGPTSHPSRRTRGSCCGCGRPSSSIVIGCPSAGSLVCFDYPTLSGPGSRNWLLIERGDAEICEKYPGGEEHLVVVVHDPACVRALAPGRVGGATPCDPGRSR